MSAAYTRRARPRASNLWISRDAIEVCGGAAARVDDLLPTERKTNGVVTPTGRPPKQLVVLAGEDEEGSMQGSWESVLLPLRSRSSGQASTGPGGEEEEID